MNGTTITLTDVEGNWAAELAREVGTGVWTLRHEAGESKFSGTRRQAIRIMMGLLRDLGVKVPYRAERLS